MHVLLMLALLAQDGVEPKLLPAEVEGDGLAAKYRERGGLERDAKVVFVERFEDDRLQDRWDDLKKWPGQLSLVEDAHGGRRALRIDYARGENSGGHLYKMLDPGYDRLHLRFYVKFPADHGTVHHFVHLTGYNPPTRWPQGGAGERPLGTERFSTGIDCFGDWGRTPPPGRWGFYNYWCEMKGSKDGKFWGNEPEGGAEAPIERDRWICVEIMLKCNAVGRADGEQALWVDGKSVGRWGGYRWRKAPELKVNGVWLLYYITDDAVRRSRGEPKNEHVLFDDVVVATDYIGPD